MRSKKDKACDELIHRRLLPSQLIANCDLVTRAAAITGATAIAILSGLGLIDLEHTATQLRAIEPLDSSSPFFLRLHLDEAKAA